MQWGRRKNNSSERTRREEEISKWKYSADRLQVLWRETCTRQIKVPCINGQQCNKCGKSNYFAAKCIGGRQSSRNLHANQNLNYVQEDPDGSQFEEYTIDVIT